MPYLMIGLILLLCWTVYQLLPAVYVHLISDYKPDLPLYQNRWVRLPGMTIASGILAKIRVWLTRAGYYHARALPIYLSLHLVPVILWFPLRFSFNPPFVGLILLECLFVSVLHGKISKQIMTRRQAYDRSLYKIYRFLDIQLTSGVLMTDVLKSLPDAVHNPIVRPVLVRFSSVYLLTSDFSLAANELEQAFGRQDTNMLATHLQQGLKTGIIGRSFLRMEELLFARYLAHIQAQSKKIGTYLLMAALLILVPLILVLLVPLLRDAWTAVNSLGGF